MNTTITRSERLKELKAQLAKHNRLIADKAAKLMAELAAQNAIDEEDGMNPLGFLPLTMYVNGTYAIQAQTTTSEGSVWVVRNLLKDESLSPAYRYKENKLGDFLGFYDNEEEDMYEEDDE